MDTMLLIGADDVRAGGYAVGRGAQEMKNAAATMDYSLQQHRQWMDEWLMRFESVVQAAGAGPLPPQEPER